MPRTIRNEGRIIIDRKFTGNNNEEIINKVDIGGYCFEGTRDISNMSSRLYLDNPIEDLAEITQVSAIYNKEYQIFMSDIKDFGWESFDVSKENEKIS